MGLEGQVALVTGAGRGIGRGHRARSGPRGHARRAARRDEATLDARLVEFTEPGADVMTVHADVTVEQQVRTAVAAAQRHFGPLDLVVSNAGRRESGDGAPWESDADDWWQTIETNLRGPFRWPGLCCQR